MSDLQEQVNNLAHKHQPLQEAKIERYGFRLNRMAKFYEAKAPDAPVRQGQMFIGFMHALIYAQTIMVMYRKLTKQLNELAEGEDETRTNS